MKRLASSGMMLGLLFSSVAFAKAPAGDWDAKAAAELKATEEKMLQSWEKGDLAGVSNAISDNMWGAWDLDMAGRPIGWATKKDVIGFFEGTMKQLKQMGGTMKWTSSKLECRAHGIVGICEVEGEQTVTMPKMPPMTVSVRATDVATKEKGGWKFVHHHGSVGKAPPMPSKFMALNAKNAQWMDAGPDMPGIKIAMVWMNPATMQSAVLMKVTQAWKQARHIHPYAMTYSLLEGSFQTSDASGKLTEYGPGSVIYRAANEVHETTLKPGAVVFAISDGPMMQINVDDKGQPIQHASAK